MGKRISLPGPAISAGFSAMELRACYPSMKQFYDYEPGVGFVGIFGPQGNLYLEILRHLNVSLQMRPKSKIGNPIPGKDGEYSGCLGLLQKNESDLALFRVNIPIDAPRMIQGPITGADIQAVSSCYNMKVNVSSFDMMDSFKSFLPETWTLIMLSYAVIFILTSLIMWSEVKFSESWKVISRQRKIAIYGTLVTCSIRKKPNWNVIFGDSLKLVSSSLLDHYSSCATIKCQCIQFKTLQFFVILLGFFITLYFGNMIKTEMVVSQKPTTIESYDQFLEREDVFPVFNGAGSDRWTFEAADPSSVKGRIWARAKKVGLKNSVLGTNLEAVKHWIECMVEQRCALFTAENFARVSLSNFCSMSRAQGVSLDTNVLIRPDSQSQEQLSGLMLASLIHPDLKSILLLNFGRVLANGLMFKAYSSSYFTLSPNTGSKSIADCFANRVITKDDHVLTSPDITHFKTMFIVQTAYWAVASCFLLIELLRFCHVTRMKRKENQTAGKQQLHRHRERFNRRPFETDDQLIQRFRGMYKREHLKRRQ